MIILAAAVGLNNELGREDGKPLWDLPDEYATFREHIRLNPVIMGRKSFDVIGKPLEDSLNIVITRQKNYDGKGAIVVHSLEDAIRHAGTSPKIFVIGGGEIFKMAIEMADRIEISRINGFFPSATAFFPQFSPDDWEPVLIDKHAKDDRHAFSYISVQLVRK